MFRAVLLLSILFYLFSCNLEPVLLLDNSGLTLNVRSQNKSIIIEWDIAYDEDLVGVNLSIYRVTEGEEELVEEHFIEDSSSYTFSAGKRGFYTIYVKGKNREGHYTEALRKQAFFFITDLPIIYVDTPDGKGVTTKEYLKKTRGMSTFSIRNADFYNIYTQETDIKGRGNSTWTKMGDKKPYNLKLSNDIKPFGMGKSNKWILLANAADRSLIRTEFVFTMANDILSDVLAYTPSGRAVELVLDGDYRGTYQLVEQKKVAKNRIDIDISAGEFLIEVEQIHDATDVGFDTEKGIKIKLRDPEEEDEVDKIKGVIDAIEALIYDEEREGLLEDKIDLDSFAAWYLVSELTKNVDSNFKSSIYFHYKNGILYMGPLWDYDLSCGNWAGTFANPKGFLNQKAGWFEPLFKTTEFKGKVKELWNAKRFGIKQHIDNIKENSRYLNQAQQNNFSRWPHLSETVFRNRVNTGSWEAEVDEVVNFLTARYAWMDAELNK